MTELTPTFAQVPYNKALNRIEQGSQSLNELITIMNERKEIEEKSVLYSAKISKSNIFEYEIDNSTNERVLGYFKNYYLYLSRVQIKNHKEVNDIIIRNLDELRTERNKVVDKYKAIISNCMKDVTSAEELLDKAKKNYVKSSKDYQLATNKLVASEIACEEWKKSMENKKLLQQQQGKSDKTNFSMGRIISAFESTPENDRDKQNKKVIKKKCEMASSFDQITEKKRNLIEKISAIDDSIAKVRPYIL